MKISIICVYNDKNLLEECLLNSLKKQKKDYELILIDNRKNEFKCAAEALNFGGRKSNGDLLLFVHQDVIFFENNLEQISNYCKKSENLGIAGVAGTDPHSGKVKSNGLHLIPPENMAITHVNGVEPAQTLDEVLLIIPRDIFENFKFDNKTCDHWHLYGADYCLQLIKNNYDVLILPIKLYHKTTASSMSLEYYKTLKKLLNKYKKDFNYIHTTCLGSHTTKNQLKINLMYLFAKFKF